MQHRGRTQLFHHGLAVHALDAVHEHARAFGDRAFRDRLPDPRRAAGDDDNFVLKSHVMV